MSRRRPKSAPRPLPAPLPPSAWMDLYDEDRLYDYYRPDPDPVAYSLRPDPPAEAPPEEPAVTIPIPDPPRPVTQVDLDIWVARLRGEFTDALAERDHRIAELEDLVLALPTGPSRPDHGERIVRFLESHPGTKFSPLSIEENLQVPKASAVCRRLAGAGRISVDARPNRHPLYFVKG